ncbi:HlyD family efflux transporter periplasmic adaptor subunit [Candidatus Soleaferrea massiliensis]|uniref:HlyD family efflux transporter periplasmic adaptor subunit n=1 Tax=Candidatus Soleaferrea massiliensis TaxID=1470354 RepID=UPI0005913A75|nr:HlyD family efflux transporter periplasmic adaptor subunit [Candidatus Soleaferrea massiliensis]
MEKIVRRLAVILIILIVLGIGGYQLFRYLNPPYKFETAYQATMDDFVEGKGLIIRNEQLIEQQAGDYAVAYTQSDGSKVAKGGKVAQLYTDDSDIQYQTQIDSMKEELELLEKAEQSAVVYLTDADMTAKQLSEQLYGLSDLMDGTCADRAESVHGELLFELNRRQVSLGTVKDFSERKSALQTQISELEGKLGAGVQDITSDEAGYFTSVVDGFEDRLSVSDLDRLKVSDLDAMMDEKQQISGTAVGKIIVGYDWRIAVPVDPADAEKFSEGSTLTVSFEDLPDVKAPGTVVGLKQDNTSDKAYAIIRLDYMNAALSRMRTAELKITFASYTGLRINKDAVRLQDGTEGVYVNEQNYAVFKRINIIYRTDAYVLTSDKGISEEELSAYSWVQLYDNIVVEGRDLYEGKPLR